MTKRNGLRKPKPTIRRAFAFGEAASGLVGQPSPVSGIDPVERAAEQNLPFADDLAPGRSRLCERSEPPSAVGGSRAVPLRTGRVAAEVFVLAVVAVGVDRALAAADVERPFRPEAEIADRVAARLLAPVFEQHFLFRFARDFFRVFEPRAFGGQSHQPAADHAFVFFRAFVAFVGGFPAHARRGPFRHIRRHLRRAEFVVVASRARRRRGALLRISGRGRGRGSRGRPSRRSAWRGWRRPSLRSPGGSPAKTRILPPLVAT